MPPLMTTGDRELEAGRPTSDGKRTPVSRGACLLQQVEEALADITTATAVPVAACPEALAHVPVGTVGLVKGARKPLAETAPVRQAVEVSARAAMARETLTAAVAVAAAGMAAAAAQWMLAEEGPVMSAALFWATPNRTNRRATGGLSSPRLAPSDHHSMA